MTRISPAVNLAIATFLAAVPASAETLWSQTISFAAPEPQPAWPGGLGVFLDETVRLSAPIAATDRLNNIAGEIVPNPLREQEEAVAMAAYRAAVAVYEAVVSQRETAQRFLDFVYPGLLATYQAAVVAWEGCRLVPFAPCGARPVAPDRPVVPALPPVPQEPRINAPATIDTRTGWAVDFAVRGLAELEFQLSASLGSVNPAFDYLITIEGPEAVMPGAFFNLDITPALVNGRMDGTTPTFRVALDQILTIDEGWVVLTGCFIPAGCATERLDFDTGGQPVRTNLLTATPEAIVFFSQTLPETLVRAGIPLMALEAVAKVDLDADDPQIPFGVSVNGISLPPNFTIGVSADVATARIVAPTVEVPGAVDNDTIAGAGHAEFIAMNLDVDATAGILGGGSLGNDFISVGFDLWDLEAGPFIDLYQDFRLWPELTVTLLFDRPVEIEGIGESAIWSGALSDLPRIAVTSNTVVTPVFHVAPTLHSEMGFQIGARFTADLIQGGYVLGPGRVEIGPAFAREFDLTSDQARLALFDTRFPLAGFAEVAGLPFTIRVIGREPGDRLRRGVHIKGHQPLRS